MANKRMFSKDIVQSDAFLDMPASTQVLYFHLGMECDDDGFVSNPKRLIKIIGTGEDDMRILAVKNFVILFASGILVIKHHRINNKWDSYNCKRTPYLEEFHQLYIKQNRAYTLDKTQGIPVQSDRSLHTVFRIEENRIEKAVASQHAFLPSEVKEVQLDSEGKEKSPKVKRDMAAWNLRDKLYDVFEDALGVRPTPTTADYVMGQSALKVLNEDEILDMVQEQLEGKKPPRTVREALSARQVDIYRQENL